MPFPHVYLATSECRVYEGAITQPLSLSRRVSKFAFFTTQDLVTNETSDKV